MESALPLLLFLGFLFGSTLLILICGMQSRAYDEASEGRSPAGLDAYELPRFFGNPGETRLTSPVALVVDEAAVREIEDFLREEMALVEIFVGDPSAEHLHHELVQVQRGPGLFERLDGYLTEEFEAAARFVSNPSSAGLHAPQGLLQYAG